MLEIIYANISEISGVQHLRLSKLPTNIEFDKSLLEKIALKASSFKKLELLYLKLRPESMKGLIQMTGIIFQNNPNLEELRLEEFSDNDYMGRQFLTQLVPAENLNITKLRVLELGGLPAWWMSEHCKG